MSAKKNTYLRKFSFTRDKPCPFESELRKFAFDFVVVIFFKNAEKFKSGGLIE